MDALLPDVLELISEHGEWILFVLALAETSFVTGLVVPSGLATSAATVLALEGEMAMSVVAAAAVAGGWTGDTIGYWIGRFGKRRFEQGRGPWFRRLRGPEAEASRFLGRHPVFSVTVARLVSFVRTLMPMAAGVSGLRYPRYLVYEIPGVFAWAAMYMGIGILAGESWDAVTRLVGLGWAVVFLVVGVILWVGRRRRRRVRRRTPRRPGAGAPGPS